MQFCPFRVLLGEMEDIGDDEVLECGVLPCPTSLAHAIAGPHGVDCDRVANHVESQRGSKKKRLLLIRNSQHETVAASSLSHNPFAALNDDQVDIVPLATNTGLTPDRVDARLRMEVGLSRGGRPFFKRGRWFIEQHR